MSRIMPMATTAMQAAALFHVFIIHISGHTIV